MVRSESDESLKIKEYFTLDSINKSAKCNVCDKQLKSITIFNMKRHVKSVHPDVADSLSVFSEIQGEPSSKRRCKKIPVAIDKQKYILGCVKLTTMNNHPLNIIDCEGFRNIVDPIEDALGFKLNSSNIKLKINYTADKFREIIKGEMNKRMVSLKIDATTVRDRSFLGINVQYLIEDAIRIRTLAVFETNDKHTSENLKKILLDVCKSFDITQDQIYSCTVDNGANMVKAVDLLKYSQSNIEIIPSDNNAPTNSSDADEDNILEFENYDVESQFIDGKILSCVRCAAHTLQLVALDVIKKTNFSTKLDKIRGAVRKFRNVGDFKRMFKQQNLKKPVIDCLTRWSSTYQMIERLVEQRSTIEIIIENRNDVQIDVELWEFMIDFKTSFQVIFEATVKLQNESLIIGDFYKIWKECEIELEEVQTIISNDLLLSLHKREKTLFENDAFVAAIFFDPRFNYLGSDYISDENKLRAKVSIRTKVKTQ